MTARLIAMDGRFGGLRRFQPAHVVQVVAIGHGRSGAMIRFVDGSETEVAASPGETMTEINKELDRETAAARTVVVST